MVLNEFNDETSTTESGKTVTSVGDPDSEIKFACITFWPQSRITSKHYNFRSMLARN